MGYFVFYDMDKERDGNLSYDEFITKSQKMTSVMKELDSIWEKLDEDGDGSVDNIEFYLNISEILPDAAEEYGEECFTEAFMDLDQDGDGLILESEMKQELMVLLEDNPNLKPHDAFK